MQIGHDSNNRATTWHVVWRRSSYGENEMDFEIRKGFGVHFSGFILVEIQLRRQWQGMKKELKYKWRKFKNKQGKLEFVTEKWYYEGEK